MTDKSNKAMKQNSDTITESTDTAFFNIWTSSRYLYEYNNLKTKSQHISNGFSESATAVILNNQ